MKIIQDIFSATPKNKTVGLCLSGGGALGLAHIGVIQSLEDHGIFPTVIAGASMGAIIGTLYAAGLSPADMLELIKNDKLYKVTKLMTFRPAFLKSGLSNHNTLRALIKELIPHNSFEQLNKRLNICVVNLNRAECEFIDAGNELDKWIAASASIPGLFETLINDGTYYVDGGLLNNMPSQGIADLCSTLIGVDVIPHILPVELKGPIDNLAFSVRAMQHQNSKSGRELCDYLIEPKAIEKYHEFSFDAYQEIYQYGYDATTKCIVNHPEMMSLSPSSLK